MRWSPGTRLNHFREKILPQAGIYWSGTPEEFYEFVVETIQHMPERTGTAMSRFYIDGDSPEKSSASGKLTTKDGRFYLSTLAGRDIIITLLKQAENGSFDRLERLYGK